MSLTFTDLQSEVKRRATKNQGGTQFDTAVKNILNTSLLHIANEANWRCLRRKATIATEAAQTDTSTPSASSVNATKDSKSYTGTNLALLANNIQVGRRIQISGSTQRYVIDTITGANAFTTNLAYDAATATGLTYTIFGTEEYPLPPQCNKVAMIWHEDFGYPFLMEYITDFDFYSSGTIFEVSTTPVYYRMWGDDNVKRQPNAASVMRISSTAAGDTSIDVTIFGIVSSYPDFEKITTNASDGTTAVSGTKSFTTVERVVKSATTTGRITVDSNSANVTVAVLPTGLASQQIEYKKIQLWPLPNRAFNLNIAYYKQPWFMVNANDVHEMGQDFDEAIILLACAKIKAEENQQEAAVFYKLYQEEIRNLRKFNMDILPNWYPRLRRPKDTRILSGGLIRRNLSYIQVGGSYGPSVR